MTDTTLSRRAALGTGATTVAAAISGEQLAAADTPAPGGGTIIENDGVALWYQTTGRGEPLVVTGGFGLLHNQWDYVRDILAKSYMVIDWNYRGAGKSDRSWPGNYTFERWVEDLKVVLDHLKVKRCHLWGTSTGAKINIRFASRFPERVQSVITYPSFRGGGRAPNDPFIPIGLSHGYEALGRMYQWYGCAVENRWNARGNEIAQYEAKCFEANFAMTTFAETLDIFGRADVGADLTRLKMPVLMLLGESGILGSGRLQNTIKDVQARCPQAELATIPKAGGTYCVIEEPEATAAAAMAFLARHPIRRS